MIRAGFDWGRDLARIALLFGHPSISVPTAIIQIASTMMPRDYWLPTLAAGFLLPGCAYAITRRPQYALIGIGTGVDLVQRLYRETNSMIQDGCNPPGSMSLLERYLFCHSMALGQVPACPLDTIMTLLALEG